MQEDVERFKITQKFIGRCVENMIDITSTINLSLGLSARVHSMEGKFESKNEWDPNDRETSLGKRMEIHLIALRSQVKEMENKLDVRRANLTE